MPHANTHSTPAGRLPLTLPGGRRAEKFDDSAGSPPPSRGPPGGLLGGGDGLGGREIAAAVEANLIGLDPKTLDRYRVLNLAWEYACDSFGARQLLFELHNAGAHLRIKQCLAQECDAKPLRGLARTLTGLERAAGP